MALLRYVHIIMRPRNSIEAAVRMGLAVGIGYLSTGFRVAHASGDLPPQTTPQAPACSPGEMPVINPGGDIVSVSVTESGGRLFETAVCAMSVAKPLLPEQEWESAFTEMMAGARLQSGHSIGSNGEIGKDEVLEFPVKLDWDRVSKPELEELKLSDPEFIDFLTGSVSVPNGDLYLQNLIRHADNRAASDPVGHCGSGEMIKIVETLLNASAQELIDQGTVIFSTLTKVKGGGVAADLSYIVLKQVGSQIEISYLNPLRGSGMNNGTTYRLDGNLADFTEKAGWTKMKNVDEVEKAMGDIRKRFGGSSGGAAPCPTGTPPVVFGTPEPVKQRASDPILVPQLDPELARVGVYALEAGALAVLLAAGGKMVLGRR
jgi:hypothetical protein